MIVKSFEDTHSWSASQLMEFTETIYGEIGLRGAWSIFESYLEKGKYPQNLRCMLGRYDWYSQRKRNERGVWQHEFEIRIGKHTPKERVIMEFVAGDLRNRGETCEYIDNGVDNSGKFVEDANEDFNSLDYLVAINSNNFEQKDIKTSPVDYKATFKTTKCDDAVKKGAGFILAAGTGYYGESSWSLDHAWYAVLGPNAVKSLLTLPHFRYKPFGYKWCVQIGPGGDLPYARVPFEELFTIYYPGQKNRFKGADNNFVDFSHYRRKK